MKLLHFLIIFSLIVLSYYFYTTKIFEGYANISQVKCSIGDKYTRGKDMIIAVSYGRNLAYNVAKGQVNDVITRIQRKYPYAKLCDRSDIQGLVNKNKPYCFCGWVKYAKPSWKIFRSEMLKQKDVGLRNAGGDTDTLSIGIKSPLSSILPKKCCYQWGQLFRGIGGSWNIGSSVYLFQSTYKLSAFPYQSFLDKMNLSSNFNKKVNTMKNYQSVYPSVRGTVVGCGGGAHRVIDCGNISRTNGKSGVYVKLKAKKNEVISKLRQQDLAAEIVWESVKCYPKVYNNKFQVSTLPRKSIWFLAEGGANDYVVKGINMETAVEMANKYVYAIEYNKKNKKAIFRTYTREGLCPKITITNSGSWNINIIPKRWNGENKDEAETDIIFKSHIGNRLETKRGVNDITIEGISIEDAKNLVRDNTYAIVYNKKKSVATLLSYTNNHELPNDIDIIEDKNSDVYSIEERYFMDEPIINPFKYQQDKRVSSYISPIKPEPEMDRSISYSMPPKFQDRKCDLNSKKNCFSSSEYIDNNLGIWNKRDNNSWNYLGKEKDNEVLNYEYNNIKV
jgi:hypothetical protein